MATNICFIFYIFKWNTEWIIHKQELNECRRTQENYQINLKNIFCLENECTSPNLCIYRDTQIINNKLWSVKRYFLKSVFTWYDNTIVYLYCTNIEYQQEIMHFWHSNPWSVDPLAYFIFWSINSPHNLNWNLCYAQKYKW